MPYIVVNGITVWKNWSSYIVQPSNTTNPIAAVNTSIQNALPWFWPVIPFFIYLALLITYNDSPSKAKFVGIAGLVLVISLFAGAFNLWDAAVNIMIFIIAWVISFYFKQ